MKETNGIKTVNLNTMVQAIKISRSYAKAKAERASRLTAEGALKDPELTVDDDGFPEFNVSFDSTIFHEKFMDNKRLGNLVFAFITDYLIQNEYFDEDWNPLKGYPFNVESIGEPGLKSRTVTKGPVIIQVYLQLCAHVFNNI